MRHHASADVANLPQGTGRVRPDVVDDQLGAMILSLLDGCGKRRLIRVHVHAIDFKNEVEENFQARFCSRTARIDFENSKTTHFNGPQLLQISHAMQSELQYSTNCDALGR